MDRIKNYTMRILEKHRSLFTDNFEDNKFNLGRIANIRSKQLRNKIAGYITYQVKQEKSESDTNHKESTE